MFSSAFSENGELVVTGSHGGAHVWRTNTAELVRAFRDGCFQVGFGPEQSTVFLDNQSLQNIEQYQIADGTLLRQFDLNLASNTSTHRKLNWTLLPGGAQPLLVSSMAQLKLFDIGNAECLYTFDDGRSERFQALAVHPTNDLILAVRSGEDNPGTIDSQTTHPMCIATGTKTMLYELQPAYNTEAIVQSLLRLTGTQDALEQINVTICSTSAAPQNMLFAPSVCVGVCLGLACIEVGVSADHHTLLLGDTALSITESLCVNDVQDGATLMLVEGEPGQLRVLKAMIAELEDMEASLEMDVKRVKST